MDKKEQKISLAYNIAKLRKKHGLTQEQLAEKLFVSNKAVSKWERGAGYPEITQLVSLSEIFGVPVDTLMKSEKSGIAIAGNMLTDFVKLVDVYPEKGMLANVISISKAVGGCVPNTIIDLAKIDRSVPLYAYGMVGDDDGGKYITFEMQRNGVDVSGISVSKTTATSFSDVMSVESTGERTFFHHKGANSEFAPKHVPVESLTCKMLHVGYILLLDEFDKKDDEYGTVMARFLKQAQDMGIKTSIDVVSDSGDRFAEKVIPALKYTDNAIMNEIEACGVSGLKPRDENKRLIIDNIKLTMRKILDCGVRERVIIHCPEAGFAMNKSGEFTVVPSVWLPKGYIKGAVGAGDAFCAGCLYGIYNGFTDAEILEFASGAAACNLAAADSVSGMQSKEYILDLIAKNGKEDFPYEY